MDITVALGGGGARGNAHIGVIRRLEKEGFRIRAIAGTSFGGLVAAYYAMGYTPDQIEDMFSRFDQSLLYGHAPGEGPSLLGLAGVTNWLEGSLAGFTFDDLKVPCVLTAVDLRSGNEIVFSGGRLVDAILGSIAVPGIFPARHVDGQELVDGGILDPVPVGPARSLASRLPVVAVVLTTPLGGPAKSWSIPMPSYLPQVLVHQLRKTRYALALDTFMRSLDIVSRAITHYRLEVDRPDVIIRPRVSDIDSLDRVDVHAVARIGEAAVEEVLPELKRLFKWRRRFHRALGARS
ncbi:MAG TPA: patatin-like phospholipase family protein [Anaerolineales bacterium]|nr:patatin-like phospholipase family protein [Anaerolineales bacterium]